MKTLTENCEQRAIEKFREYAADDAICRERLQPIIDAHEKGDRALFAEGLRKLGEQYSACHWSIDQLVERAQNNQIA